MKMDLPVNMRDLVEKIEGGFRRLHERIEALENKLSMAMETLQHAKALNVPVGSDSIPAEQDPTE
jgi:hypothetical protein